jgi:tellurite resistance protein
MAKTDIPDDEVSDWLRQHPEVWTGWPTYTLFDSQERRALTQRLLRAPRWVKDAGLIHLTNVIGQLRSKHRKRYQKRVSRKVI